MKVICDYCREPAKLVGGDVIYPHRPDLAHKLFWLCDPCDAYVGCHRPPHGDGTRPLGRLANAELRRVKSAAHAAFDPIWQSGSMKRRKAYAWLAGVIGIPKPECHMGLMDVERCRAVVAAVKARKLAPGADK